jgi:hypothetical protein
MFYRVIIGWAFVLLSCQAKEDVPAVHSGQYHEPTTVDSLDCKTEIRTNWDMACVRLNPKDSSEPLAEIKFSYHKSPNYYFIYTVYSLKQASAVRDQWNHHRTLSAISSERCELETRKYYFIQWLYSSNRNCIMELGNQKIDLCHHLLSCFQSTLVENNEEDLDVILMELGGNVSNP